MYFGATGNCKGCDQAAVYFQAGLMDGGSDKLMTLKIQESHTELPKEADADNWVDVAGKKIDIKADAVDYQLLSIGIRSSELSRKYWRWHVDIDDAAHPSGFIGAMIIGSSASYNPVTITVNNAIIVD